MRFRAAGSSMKPLIFPGAALDVDPVPPESLRAGDVLLFRDGAQLVAHRLVLHLDDPDRGRLLYVRGDNRADIEGPVPPELILGRVRRVCLGRFRYRPDAPWVRAAYPLVRGLYRSAVRVKHALVG